MDSLNPKPVTASLFLNIKETDYKSEIRKILQFAKIKIKIKIQYGGSCSNVKNNF